MKGNHTLVAINADRLSIKIQDSQVHHLTDDVFDCDFIKGQIGLGELMDLTRERNITLYIQLVALAIAILVRCLFPKSTP